MWIKFSSIAAAVLLSASAGNAEVAYNVFSGNSCVQGERKITTVMTDTPQEIGYCQNHGVGAALYNSMEVISCTDNCLCFNQVAADTGDVNCDESRAIGGGVKMTCFDKCLQDCNGPNCGDHMQPDSFITRLQLTGEGPICASPVSEEDFVCETTNMIKDEDGNMVDDFTRDTSAIDWSSATSETFVPDCSIPFPMVSVYSHQTEECADADPDYPSLYIPLPHPNDRNFCYGWAACDAARSGPDCTPIYNSMNNISCSADGKTIRYTQFIENLNCEPHEHNGQMHTGQDKVFTLDECHIGIPPSMRDMALNMACCIDPTSEDCAKMTGTPKVNFMATRDQNTFVTINGDKCEDGSAEEVATDEKPDNSATDVKPDNSTSGAKALFFSSFTTALVVVSALVVSI